MTADDLSRIAMSASLGSALARAGELARRQGHIEVTLEHILLSLCEDPDAGLVLASSNIDQARLRNDVSGYLANLPKRGVPGQASEPGVSLDLRRILEAAAAAARGGRRQEINGAIVLAAIVGDGRSPAAHMLQAQGLTFEGAIRALQRGPSAAAAPSSSTEDILASARERVLSRTGLAARKMAPAPAKSESADRDAEGIGASEPESDEPAPAEKTEAAPAVVARPPPARESKPLPPRSARKPPSPPPASETTRSGDGLMAGLGSRTPATETFPAAAEPPPQAMPARSPVPPSPPPGAGAAPPAWAPPPQAMPPAAAPPMPLPPPPPMPPPIPPMPAGGEPRLPMGGASPSEPSSLRHRLQPESRRPEGIGSAYSGPSAYERLAGPRQAPPGRFPAPPAARSVPVQRAEIGQLVENIPRTMRVAIPATVEVRIAKADVKALADGLQGGGAAYQHEVTITKAMSVRLRAPDGGFFIETASPETQWIERAMLLSSDDYASWRWHVTPRERGKKRLQLVISARTVGGDGLTAETALPDQVISVRVRTNYGKTASHWVGWGVAAVAGGLIAKFGENMLDAGIQVVAKLTAG
jgi:neural Wiskott-Aldrich syndrome protein